MKNIILLIILFATISIPQRLQYNLSHVAGSYAEAYIQPFTNAYGAMINSGFARESHYSTGLFGLRVYVGGKVFGSFIPDRDKEFNISYNEKVNYIFNGVSYQVNAEVTVNNAPTIFGSAEAPTAIMIIRDTINAGIVVVPIEDTRYFETFGGLYETSIAGLFIPHIEIGGILGTDLVLRYLPPIKLREYGELNFFGLGVRHTFTNYFPGIPFDISALAAFQGFDVEDSTGKVFIKSRSFLANLTASKNFSFLTFYSGFQYETSNLDVDYTYQPPPSDNNPNPPPVHIVFNMDGENKFRFFVGSALKIGPIVFNLDYNFAKYNIISGGLGISLQL
jgi:hypothetical protein